MGNFKIKKDALEFKINGADKFTSFIIICLLFVIMVIVIILAVVLLDIGYFQNNPILSGIFLIVLFLALTMFLLLLVKMGVFSRYIVKLNKNIIEIYDSRNDRTVMSERIDDSKLYIADTRQQIGYVSIKMKAFCYGAVKQIFVEDRIPNKEFILLCIGKKDKIDELKDKVLSLISK